MKRTLVIVGRVGTDETGRERGLMARELLRQCTMNQIPSMLIGKEYFASRANTGNIHGPDEHLVVYVGSKGSFQYILRECQLRNLTLIVVSSGITEADIPADISIPVILAPNLAVLIMAIFESFRCLGRLISGFASTRVIAEGHQASKTSAPSTAEKLADLFDVPHSEIGHVRNDAIATAVLGIPRDALDGFGKHYVNIELGQVRFNASFEVHGRSAYFEGLKMIIDKIEALGADLGSGVKQAQSLLFPSFEQDRDLLSENVSLRHELQKLRQKMAGAELQKILDAGDNQK